MIMPIFNLAIPPSKRCPFTDQQRLIYGTIIMTEPIHSYLYNENWMYVISFTKNVFIHYTIDSLKDGVQLNWSLSHAVTHITIPEKQ